MRIVNKSGLSEIIFKYLQQDFYDGTPDSISATTLLKPVQEYWLTKRHDSEIEVDASSRIWTLFGSSIHAVLEKLEGNYEQEERLFAEIDGVKISGKFDIIEGTKLYDFKCTSAWTLKYGSRLEEWKEQLSIYRWLYKASRCVTLDDTAIIVAILRDWAKRELLRVENYPKLPIVEVPIELMSLKDTEKMIKKKLKLIAKYKDIEDEELLECTLKQTWYNEKQDKHNKCGEFCLAAHFCQQLKRRENGTNI
jgi:hypothetical protein